MVFSGQCESFTAEESDSSQEERTRTSSFFLVLVLQSAWRKIKIFISLEYERFENQLKTLHELSVFALQFGKYNVENSSFKLTTDSKCTEWILWPGMLITDLLHSCVTIREWGRETLLIWFELIWLIRSKLKKEKKNQSSISGVNSLKSSCARSICGADLDFLSFEDN